MIEQWKPVEGFEGAYRVSDFGRVLSLSRMVVNGRRGSSPTRERIVTPKRHTQGYLFVILSASGKRKKYYIHRLVAAAFIPNPLEKRNVNHLDGNKQNNCAGNLEWATHAENMRHAVDTGLQKCDQGENWHAAKLTDDQVREIRAAYIPGRAGNTVLLAEKFGVVRETINGIGNWRKWKHVECSLECRCSACKRVAA